VGIALERFISHSPLRGRREAAVVLKVTVWPLA
jgi:hypothetical protein